MWEKVYRQYYHDIRNASSAKDDFIDLSTVFEHATDYPYVDSHHYSPYGNRLIAEAIAGYLIDREDRCRAIRAGQQEGVK